MRHLYYVTKIRRMPVRLHYTWAIVVLLGIPVLSGLIIPAALPTLGGLARVMLALLILALFFGAVLLHEGAHLLVARLLRIRPGTLNLYPLGALTRLPNRQRDASTMFWIAAAGPLASIGLWGVLRAIVAVGFLPIWLAVALDTAGAMSLYLGLINLLPAYPLDGGRMLRALLWVANRWLLTGDFTSATRVARLIGQISAYGLMLLGAILLIGGQDWLLPGTLILIGWAILDAGSTAVRRALVADLLRKLNAADVLVAPSRTIGPERTLSELAGTLGGSADHEPTPVIANGMFLGMIDREQLRAIPNGDWEIRTVAETMAPAASLDIIAPRTPASQLIPRLADAATGPHAALPVVQEGRLVGVIKAEEMRAFLDLEDAFGLYAHGTPEEHAPAEAAASV